MMTSERQDMVRALDGEVVIDHEIDDEPIRTTMTPEAAEELAHALLLCAHSARGYKVDEGHRRVVETWVLRR